MPDPESKNKKRSYAVIPVAATVLESGDTVLIANGARAYKDGTAHTTDRSKGHLNIYFLRKENEKWKVLRRHENIAELGSYGEIGEVVWTTLAPGKPGLGVISEWTAHGYSSKTLSLYDLSSNDIHNLAPGGADTIEIHYDNSGNCEHGTDKCWGITGELRFSPSQNNAIYDDLVIEFSGEKPIEEDDEDEASGQDAQNIASAQGTQDEALGQDAQGEASTQDAQDEASGEDAQDETSAQDVKRLTTKVHSTSRYAFDGKAYRLVEGVDVMPHREEM
jgi:hypothetical protein